MVCKSRTYALKNVTRVDEYHRNTTLDGKLERRYAIPFMLHEIEQNFYFQACEKLIRSNPC